MSSAKLLSSGFLNGDRVVRLPCHNNAEISQQQLHGNVTCTWRAAERGKCHSGWERFVEPDRCGAARPAESFCLRRTPVAVLVLRVEAQGIYTRKQCGEGTGILCDAPVSAELGSDATQPSYTASQSGQLS